MLFKLSITGIRSKLRDYVTLFSGLTITAAIFYMFLTIATNKQLLEDNLTLLPFDVVQLVFDLGIALLVIITLVYLIYANSCLLSMRKRDYALYLMLGAKNQKIGQLIFTETLLIGLLATIIGEALGVALTQLVSKQLISSMGLQIHHFVGFYLPALINTIIFFAVIFMISALFNRHKLVTTPIINLLKSDATPTRTTNKYLLVKAVAGVLLLATGYLAMANWKVLLIYSIVIAFITIVIGTFLIFDSFFTILIKHLRRGNSAAKGLNSFTLGQLNFRLASYTKILSIISLMFALALGAITVGMNMMQVTEQNDDANYYDAIIYHETSKVKRQLKQLDLVEDSKLTYKENQTTLFLNRENLDQVRPKWREYMTTSDSFSYKTNRITAKTLTDENLSQLEMLLPVNHANKTLKLKVVTKSQYDALTGKNQHVRLIRVANFRQHWQQVLKLQIATLGQSADRFISPIFKAMKYQAAVTLVSGFTFMGFFLGIAFLTMLASTLMFKILSGASADQPRYRMLWKIGASTKLLKASIRKELAVLFAAPAVLGIIDVLFGLKFFTIFFTNPYHNIQIPFTIFLILYLLYYLITTKIYESLVLTNWLNNSN